MLLSHKLRRRWRTLACVLVFICVSYSLTQIFFLSSLDQSESSDESSSQDEQLTYSSAFMALQYFTSACHAHALPVFLIDPAALTSVLSGRPQDCDGEACRPDCPHLGGRKALTSFGVMSDMWNPSKKFMAELSSRHLSVIHNVTLASTQRRRDFLLSFNNNSSYKLPAIPQGPAHLVLSYNQGQHFIHLVIFYERSDNYMWHAPFNDVGNNVTNRRSDYKQRQADWRRLVMFGKNLGGSYENLDLMKLMVDGLRLRVPNPIPTFLTQITRSSYVDCDLDRAAQFYEMYGARDTSEQAERFRKDTVELLSTVKRALDKLGVRFWISSGTCLGWYRQCDVIPYSGDVDIGVFVKEMNYNMITALEYAGLNLIQLFGKVSDSYELSFRFEGSSVKLDVFFFYEESDHVWNGGTQARTGKKFKYIFPKFTLCWTEFLGLRLLAPCQTESYIKANYGPDWFKPVHNWDWKKSPPNVVENGVWPSEELKKVVQIFEGK